MLRTSLRREESCSHSDRHSFLSSNAQDFIEDVVHVDHVSSVVRFLSSTAQYFIEEATGRSMMARRMSFLSSNAQDFIEER